MIACVSVADSLAVVVMVPRKNEKKREHHAHEKHEEAWTANKQSVSSMIADRRSVD